MYSEGRLRLSSNEYEDKPRQVEVADMQYICSLCYKTLVDVTSKDEFAPRRHTAWEENSD